MFNTAGCIYNTKQQARCLAALVGDTGHHRFLVGTCSLRQKNSIHLLQYDDEKGVLGCEAVLAHEKEIWHISPSPVKSSLLSTCYNAGNELRAKLWRINELDKLAATPIGHEAEKQTSLDEVASFPESSGQCYKTCWNPSSNVESTNGKIASLHTQDIRIWDLGASDKSLKEASTIATITSSNPSSALYWNPHHPDEICSLNGTSLSTWDLRTKASAISIPETHEESVRDMDYNPNKPFAIVTAGDDCRVRFWDLRKPDRPLKSMVDHTHWVMKVKYNRFHDQLVLSSGADSIVNLWRVSSISSAPLLELADGSTEIDAGDAKIKSFEEHEDSVYGAAWSAMDAWVFASLSYDGRVVLSQVPSTEKYKILL